MTIESATPRERSPVKPRGRPLDPEIDDAIVRAAAHVMLTDGHPAHDGAGRRGRRGRGEDDRLPPVRDAGATRPRGDQSPQSPGPRDPESGIGPHGFDRVLEEARQRIDPTVTATVLVEAQTHPEVLEAARRADDRARRSTASAAPSSRASSARNSAPISTSRLAAHAIPRLPTSRASTNPAGLARSGPSEWWTNCSRDSGDVAAAQQERGAATGRSRSRAGTAIAWALPTNGPENEPGPLLAIDACEAPERGRERVAVGAQEDLRSGSSSHAVGERAQQPLDHERVEDPDADRQRRPARQDAEQHAHRRPHGQDQPARGERANEQPRRRPVAGASSICAITKLATAPAANRLTTNRTSTMPSATSLDASTRNRPGRCVNRVLSVPQLYSLPQREHAQHEREHAAEEREALQQRAGQRFGQELARARRGVLGVERVRDDVREEDARARSRCRAGSRWRRACAARAARRDVADHAGLLALGGQVEEDVLQRRPLAARARATVDAARTRTRLSAAARAGSAVTSSAPSGGRPRSTPGWAPSSAGGVVDAARRARAGPARPRSSLDRPFGDERAVADDADAVADLLDLAHQVAGEHDRALAAGRARG